MAFDRVDRLTNPEFGRLVLEDSAGFVFGESGDNLIFESSEPFTYSEKDFFSNTIFVPIDTTFNVVFNEAMSVETVTVHTNNDILRPENVNNPRLNFDGRNKRGSIQLSSIGDEILGAKADPLNLRTLKQESKPLFVNEADDGNTIASEQTATIEVEMQGPPVVSTNSNSSFTFSPVTNLASNTTYFFNITPDALDDFQNPIEHTVGGGFVTDNTQSVLLSTEPFSGYKASFPVYFNNKFVVNESIKKKGSVLPVGQVQEQITTSTIRYLLDDSCFFIGKTFTTGNPCTITSLNHGLLVNDVITVFDIESGTGIETKDYKISAVTTDTISLDGLNNPDDTSGKLSFLINFKAKDIIVTTRDSNNIESFLEQTPTKIITNFERNGKIKQIVPASENYARVVRYDEDEKLLSYIKFSDDSFSKFGGAEFSNNVVLEQTTNDGLKIRGFVRANTNPTHNVHPFNTSAPFVTEVIPEKDGQVTTKLLVSSVVRDVLDGVVTTNGIHDLSIGDAITIDGANEDDYNITSTVRSIINSISFTYGDIQNNPTSPATGALILKVGSNEKISPFQVRFSQSMNTSTIRIANNSHHIYVDGTTITINDISRPRTDSTIQLSYDNFENLVNLETITANTGNSLFTITPDKYVKGRSYKVRVTTNVRDLGSTNTNYQYTTNGTFSTGIKNIDATTGKEVIFVDNIPPEVRKVTLGGDKFLISNTISEITSPDDIDALAIDLSGESFSVQFNESMNTETVNVNSSNTDSLGTIQISHDNFVTVVEMDAQPTVTTTDIHNDTFTFKPKASLSSNTNYVFKITTNVSDDAPNQNFLVNANVSRTRIMTLASGVSGWTTGEVIRGTRTASVTSNTGSFLEGLETGEIITGDTSLAKGRIFDYAVSDDVISSIRYSEIKSDDGKIRELIPGETITGKLTGSKASLSKSSITIAPEGTLVSYDNSTAKITYLEANSSYPFTAGSSSANVRIVGAKSNVHAKTSTSTGITNAGFSTTTTALTVSAKFRQYSGDTIVDLSSNRTGIDVDSNVFFVFNQTMNVDSLSFNSTDEEVSSDHNIILSYDSSFGNCIPLDSTFTTSNNGSTFEFKPRVVTEGFHLGMNKNLYCKVTRSAKTPGSTNLASDTTFSGNYANTTTSIGFNVSSATIRTEAGKQYSLGLATDQTPSGASDLPNVVSGVSNATPIILEFDSQIDFSTFTYATEIELSSTYNHASGEITSGTITQTGIHGNQIIVVPNSALAAGTRYFLRIVKTASNPKSVGGVQLGATTYFNSFTTTS